MRRWFFGGMVCLVVLCGACDDGVEADVEVVPDLGLFDAGWPDSSPHDVGLDAARDATLDVMVDADADDAALDADVAADAMADAAEDATVGIRPDELPLLGAPDMPGAADLTVQVAVGRARAGWVDTPEEALTGPEAACRPGCLRLDNARISVCIQGAINLRHTTFAGGNIIDAHLAGRPGTDRLSEVLITPGMGEVTVEEIGIVRDGADGGAAVIRTEGRADGGRLITAYIPTLVPPDLRVVTEYRLAPGASEVEVWTWFEADVEGGTVSLVDAVALGDRTTPAPVGAPVGGMPAMGSAYLASDAPEVSYGWVRGDGPMEVNDGGNLLPVAFMMYGNVVLARGDMVLLRRRFLVGGGDIEAVRPIADDAVSVTLTGPPGARIDVARDGIFETRALLDAEGRRMVRLSAGVYTAHAHQWAGGAAGPFEFEAVAGAVVDVVLPEPATLRLRVVDAEGRGLAAKVWLRGPWSKPLFVVDEATVEVPAGSWRVATTRGWHYTQDDRTIELVAGASVTAEIVLTEVIEFNGWSAGEFHQHASPSLDSVVPMEVRVLSNLAEGVGFMVPSDHDVMVDYVGLVTRMGLADRIATPITGVEVSPLAGHFGAYGIPYDADTSAGGAIPLSTREADGRWRVKDVGELMAEARAAGAEIIQVNHPRAVRQAFFNLVNYDPEAPLAEVGSQHWTTDFDTVEIYNGAAHFCEVWVDWLGLLNQGLLVTAVGNSDTHTETAAAGFPRNYLPTAASTAAGISHAEVVDGLRRGRVVVAGGAVMDFPDGQVPGDVIEVLDGTLRLRVRLRTPPTGRLTRLVALHNGQPVFDRVLDTDRGEIVDFDGVIEVPVDQDGYVVLFAEGDTTGGGPTFALANPFWVDVDGAGAAHPGVGPIALPEGLAACRW